MTQYDQAFFDYVNQGALRSAAVVVPLVVRALNLRSVLDVGCGQGAWLSVYGAEGVQDVFGVDGEYVDQDRLLISAAQFRPQDLRSEFDLGRRFDLVQSLEVAEHLPASAARTFVESLTRHGDRVLFSAAPKGQGGDHHVNEQSYDYWRRLFAGEGYEPFDFVRPGVSGDTRVEPWYRYNTILYVARDAVMELPEVVGATRIDDGAEIDDVSPLTYKVRKSVVGLLPVGVMTALAKVKERWTAGRIASRAGRT